jgi:hypothetical protein
MPGRQLAVILLSFGVLLTSGGAVAQDVKSTFNRSVDFTKYKKFARGSNYLLTQQPKDIQERINMAIVDSINRNLRSRVLWKMTRIQTSGLLMKPVGSPKPTWARSDPCTLRTRWATTGAT